MTARPGCGGGAGDAHNVIARDVDGKEMVPLAHEELDGVHVDRVGRAACGDDLRTRGRVDT